MPSVGSTRPTPGSRQPSLGSLEAANAVSRIAGPRIELLADAGDVDAQATIAGILLDYYVVDALPVAVAYAKAAAEAGHPAGLRTYGHMFAEATRRRRRPRSGLPTFERCRRKGRRLRGVQRRRDPDPSRNEDRF